jgi:hypothetical protein
MVPFPTPLGPQTIKGSRTELSESDEREEVVKGSARTICRKEVLVCLDAVFCIKDEVNAAVGLDRMAKAVIIIGKQEIVFIIRGERLLPTNTLLPTTEIERNDRLEKAGTAGRKQKLCGLWMMVMGIMMGMGSYQRTKVVTPNHTTTRHLISSAIVSSTGFARFGGWLGARPGAGRTKK